MSREARGVIGTTITTAWIGEDGQKREYSINADFSAADFLVGFSITQREVEGHAVLPRYDAERRVA